MRGVRMRAALYGVIFSMGFFLSKGFISTGGCFFGTDGCFPAPRVDVFRPDLVGVETSAGFRFCGSGMVSR